MTTSATAFPLSHLSPAFATSDLAEANVAENRTREALEELLDYLEQVETKSGALLQFLMDKGMLTEEQFKPYLDKASNATDVKSRAIHARFDFLFTKDDAKPATEAVPGGNASNQNVAEAAAGKKSPESDPAGGASEEPGSPNSPAETEAA